MIQFRTLIFFMALLVTACVTPQTKTKKIDSVASEIEAKIQRELVAQDFIETYDRLFTIGHPILVKAASLCEKTSYQFGMDTWTAKGMEHEWEEAYRSVYGLSDLLEIGFLTPDGAAITGGLEKGDILVSVNDWSVPLGDKAYGKFNKKMKKLSESPDSVTFKIRREEEYHTFTIPPVKTCDYEIALDNTDMINAFADGEKIIFMKGMMDFFRTDQELALVFSHELAHNTMKHSEAKKTNMALGTAGGFLVDILGALAGVNTQGTFSDMGMRNGAKAFSPAFEAEADYVGLYILAVSGHEIEKSSHFWRRMSLKNSRGISLTTTHPANADRFVGIENAIKEIKAKKLAGQPLKPEMKDE